MGRVAGDFGVGQGAKRSEPDWHTDIRSDLGPASNAGQRQNQRNRRRREAEGQLAPKAFGAGGVARSLQPALGMRLPRSLPSALLPLRATQSSPRPSTLQRNPPLIILSLAAGRVAESGLRHSTRNRAWGNPPWVRIPPLPPPINRTESRAALAVYARN